MDLPPPEQDTPRDAKRPFGASDHLRWQDGHPPCARAVEFTETIGGLIGKREERYGVEIPLSDLFLFDTPAAPLDRFVHTF